MSNERIDLKQFEGIGEWKVLAHRHNKVIDWQVKTGRNMRSKEEAETIAKLPSLIAELKRCYDFIEGYCLDEDIEHKMVIDLRECSWECLHQLCVQAGVEDGTKEEMIARLLE
jgi:polyhydroxyalkanoate synthesis regulator phasin